MDRCLINKSVGMYFKTPYLKLRPYLPYMEATIALHLYYCDDAALSHQAKEEVLYIRAPF